MPQAKFLAVGAIIIGTVSYLMFSGISDSMVYYYTVPEVLEQAQAISGKGIRVSGYVSPGTIRRENRESRVHFTVFDRESDRTLPVIYQGIIPDTFKDNAEVVVEGSYRPDESTFHAHVLLAKCPSKYEAAGEEHPEDVAIGKESEQ